MNAISTKKIPPDSLLTCFACKKNTATHACRYESGELVVQICLCKACMDIDAGQLLKNSIGLREFEDMPATFV